MEFAEMLRHLRKRAGFSQEGLAREAEVSVATIVKLEAGRVVDPTWSTIRRLAKALKVDCRVFEKVPLREKRRGPERKRPRPRKK
jgi:transcriptional regulator with XRE-family HTH domain